MKGLPLATRYNIFPRVRHTNVYNVIHSLSDNGGYTVGVIDSGEYRKDDPLVTTPGKEIIVFLFHAYFRNSEFRCNGI